MHRRTRPFQILTIILLGHTATALAEETAEAPAAAPAAAEPTSPAAATEPGTEAAAAPDTEETVTAAPAKPDLNAAMYGMAFRFRWVSVPGWFLDLFTKKNVALSSYSWAVEGYRRKHDKDDPNRTWELVVGIGYQNMSPPDGYWLGKNKDPAMDADMVQMRDFSLVTMDAAFISRQYFHRYFGIHYGAGLGLAIVRGKILRTSATYNQASGQYTVQSGGNIICRPDGSCTESALVATQGQPDNGPGDPHRFQENDVPGAIPIINLLVGLDFPIPDAKGLEFRIEGGFFNAFFLGGTLGWVF